MSGTAQVNGPQGSERYLDGVDPEDPEYIKNLQRPAEVKEDLHQMENRSRVKVVLNSECFKEELEQIVDEQLRNGPYPASLLALQQINELLMPTSRGGLNNLSRASTVIPINDLKGADNAGFVKGEKLLRCKVAALYRLVDLHGWSQGIYNHISARVSSDEECFLLNPFGMVYSEVTASSLVKVDVNGGILDPGTSHFGVSKAGFTLHSAIHQARPDIKCIIHLHTPVGIAVSAMKCGLLPLCQEAMFCGNISYHDYHGLVVEEEDREKLARDLGVHNKVMVLRNHGVVACGETVEEAFHFATNFMTACEAQVRAIPGVIDNISLPSEEVIQKAHKLGCQGGGGVETQGRKWRCGEMEFEALMRQLDNSGYRTGYMYKVPMIKQDKKDRSNSEVEIPPSSSSFTYVFDGDMENSKYVSPLKMAQDRQKKAFKAGWLTSPNAYKKTELEEIGTTTPKKITRWVSEGGESPNKPGCVQVKLEHPNQFAPQGENPKELKQKQKSIRKDYYEDRVSAGPQSKILEGMSWDEAQKAKDGQLSGAGDQVIVVGAASKGIIQRDHQHNAVVYRQYYAANPFENMSEAEIGNYQDEVQKKEPSQPEESTEPQNEVQEDSNKRQEAQDTEEVISSQKEYNDIPKATDNLQGIDDKGQDEVLARLANTVVQTVMHEALAVARRLGGKGQQILTGSTADATAREQCTESLYTTGGQIENNNDQKWENRHKVEEDKSKQFNIKDKSSKPFKTKPSQHTKSTESSANGNNKAGSPKHKLFTPPGNLSARIRIDEEASRGDTVTLQINPIVVQHSHQADGMKIKFSVHSTVRRKVRAELDQESCIEEIFASATQPSVHLLHSHQRANGSEIPSFSNQENIEGQSETERDFAVEIKRTSPEMDSNSEVPNVPVYCQPAEQVSNENMKSRKEENGEKSYKEKEKATEDYGTKWKLKEKDKPVVPKIEMVPFEEQDKVTENKVKSENSIMIEPNEALQIKSVDKVNEELEPPRKSPLRPNQLLPGDKKRLCSSNKRGKRNKVKKSLAPLSPVREIAYEGTELEMDEMGELLESMDDSFERLLLTAEDDLLLCGKDGSEDLDLSEFKGITPLAADDTISSSSQIISPCNKKLVDSYLEPDNDIHHKTKSCVYENFPKRTNGSPYQSIPETNVEFIPRKKSEMTFEDLAHQKKTEKCINASIPQNKTETQFDSIVSQRKTETNVDDKCQRKTEIDFDDIPQRKIETNLAQRKIETNNDIPQRKAETIVDDIPQRKTETNVDDIPQRQIETSVDDIPQRKSEANVDDIPQRKTETNVDDIPQRKTETNVNDIPQRQIETSVDVIPQRKTESIVDIPQRKTEANVNHIPQRQIETSVDDIPQRKTESIVDIPQRKTETNVNDIPQRKTETNVDDIPQRKTETNVDDIPQKKTETNVDDICQRKIETSVDDIPQRKTETIVDDIPQRKTETNVDYIPHRKTETNVDYIPHRKTETNVDDIRQRNIETSVDDIPQRKTETNVDDIPQRKTEANDNDIPQRKTEIDVDVFPQRKTETNVDDIRQRQIETSANDIPQRKTETNVDDHPLRRTETNVDDTPLRRTETNVDDIPLRRTETNFDDIPQRKAEINVDSIHQVKTETSVDDIPNVDNIHQIKTETNDDIPQRKTETNVDDIPQRKNETNVDVIILGSQKKTETNVDEIVPESQGRTEINSYNLITKRKCETNVDDIVFDRKKETSVNDIFPEYSTPQLKMETDIDDVITRSKTSTIDCICNDTSHDSKFNNHGKNVFNNTHPDVHDMQLHSENEIDFDYTIPFVNNETDIDEIPVSKIETGFVEVMPRSETEINAQNLSQNVETNVDDIIPYFEPETVFQDPIFETQISALPREIMGNIINHHGLYKEEEEVNKKGLKFMLDDSITSEGPIQTSSPKIGRGRKGLDKYFHEDRCESEKCLLNSVSHVKSLKSDSKSQPLLVETDLSSQDDTFLTRSSSLDYDCMKDEQTSNFLRGNRFENEVWNQRETPSPTYHSSRSILDEYHLKKHNELMELSSAKSFLTSVKHQSQCSTSDIMPPLPDTEDVPSISDIEDSDLPVRRQKRYRPNLKDESGISRNHKDGLVNQDRKDTPAKSRWIPKSKRVKRLTPQIGSAQDIEKSKSGGAEKTQAASRATVLNNVKVDEPLNEQDQVIKSKGEIVLKELTHESPKQDRQDLNVNDKEMEKLGEGRRKSSKIKNDDYLVVDQKSDWQNTDEFIKQYNNERLDQFEDDLMRGIFIDKGILRDGDCSGKDKLIDNNAQTKDGESIENRTNADQDEEKKGKGEKLRDFDKEYEREHRDNENNTERYMEIEDKKKEKEKVRKGSEKFGNDENEDNDEDSKRRSKNKEDMYDEDEKRRPRSKKNGYGEDDENSRERRYRSKKDRYDEDDDEKNRERTPRRKRDRHAEDDDEKGRDRRPRNKNDRYDDEDDEKKERRPRNKKDRYDEDDDEKNREKRPRNKKDRYDDEDDEKKERRSRNKKDRYDDEKSMERRPRSKKDRYDEYDDDEKGRERRPRSKKDRYDEYDDDEKGRERRPRSKKDRYDEYDDDEKSMERRPRSKKDRYDEYDDDEKGRERRPRSKKDIYDEYDDDEKSRERRPRSKNDGNDEDDNEKARERRPRNKKDRYDDDDEKSRERRPRNKNDRHDEDDEKARERRPRNKKDSRYDDDDDETNRERRPRSKRDRYDEDDDKSRERRPKNEENMWQPSDARNQIDVRTRRIGRVSDGLQAASIKEKSPSDDSLKMNRNLGLSAPNLVGDRTLLPSNQILNLPNESLDSGASPRLSRRRGGAIAPNDEKLKKLNNPYKKARNHLFVPLSHGNALNRSLRSVHKSNVSLASSALSRRSKSSSRIFENCPELLPPAPQINPLTGEPYNFVHPLMSKSMESLLSRSSSRHLYNSHEGDGTHDSFDMDPVQKGTSFDTRTNDDKRRKDKFEIESNNDNAKDQGGNFKNITDETSFEKKEQRRDKRRKDYFDDAANDEKGRGKKEKQSGDIDSKKLKNKKNDTDDVKRSSKRDQPEHKKKGRRDVYKERRMDEEQNENEEKESDDEHPKVKSLSDSQKSPIVTSETAPVVLSETPSEPKSDSETDNKGPELPPKTGLLSRLSCVGGKSSYIGKKKNYEKSKAPLENRATVDESSNQKDYFAAEKKRMKKLAKEKEDEPTAGLYFQDEDEVNPARIRNENVITDQSIHRTKAETPNPFLTFATPSNNSEGYGDYFEEVTGTTNRGRHSLPMINQKEIVRPPKISLKSSGFDDEDSLGKHVNKAKEISDKSKERDKEDVRNTSEKKWQPRTRRDKVSPLRPRISKSPENPNPSSYRRDSVDNSDSVPVETFNSTQESDFGLAHLSVIDTSANLTDPSGHFDSSELTHYKKHNRRDSVDMDSSLPAGASPPLKRGEKSPVRRRISQVSLGGMEHGPSRTRSSSTSSNPLIYQPWRSQRKQRGRSMSISEMVYAAGVSRPSRSHSVGEITYNDSLIGQLAGRRRSRTNSIGEYAVTSRMYHHRRRSRSHSRASLGDTSFGSVAPGLQRRRSGTWSSHPAELDVAPVNPAPVKRSESAREPSKNPQLIDELGRKNLEKTKSDRRPQIKEELGEDKPVSPSKSDTMKSTDSASGGETLEERSSKEGSPTKEHPTTKDKKGKKKKFRIPSFSKKKNKEAKESAI